MFTDSVQYHLLSGHEIQGTWQYFSRAQGRFDQNILVKKTFESRLTGAPQSQNFSDKNAVLIGCRRSDGTRLVTRSRQAIWFQNKLPRPLN